MIVTKTVGYAAMIGGPSLGGAMAAVAETPWGAASWVGAGFAGLVAGYLLVAFIPKLLTEHNETIRHVTSEHKTAMDKVGKDFEDAADKIVASQDKLRDSFMQHLLKDKP